MLPQFLPFAHFGDEHFGDHTLDGLWYHFNCSGMTRISICQLGLHPGFVFKAYAILDTIENKKTGPG